MLKLIKITVIEHFPVGKIYFNRQSTRQDAVEYLEFIVLDGNEFIVSQRLIKYAVL